MLLKNLKSGDNFTLKPKFKPYINKVYCLFEFDSKRNKYVCAKLSNFTKICYLKPNTVVYTDFILKVRKKRK